MKLLICFILIFFLINGCTKENAQEYTNCPESAGEFCTQVYQPVCGDDGVTYSNSCTACQKVERYRNNEC